MTQIEVSVTEQFEQSNLCMLYICANLHAYSFTHVLHMFCSVIVFRLAENFYAVVLSMNLLKWNNNLFHVSGEKDSLQSLLVECFCGHMLPISIT